MAWIQKKKAVKGLYYIYMICLAAELECGPSIKSWMLLCPSDLGKGVRMVKVGATD